MKWLILLLLFIVEPSNLMIASKKQQKIQIPEMEPRGKLAQPFMDLKPPLDELNYNLEELSSTLDKL